MSTNPPQSARRVEGRILFDYGLPANDLAVRLYNRGYGCAAMLLGEAKTDKDGFYKLSYEAGGTPANLEVRVAGDNGKEVSISATRYNAQPLEVFNLVAPSSVRPLAAEYQRLKADINRQIGERGKLADARENPDCQDLSLLHRATNWDARLIALLAIAARLSEETRIEEAALYAMFRTGLPTNKELLAHVSATVVVKALKKSVEAGIVNLSDQQITNTAAAFKDFAGQIRRASKATGALSSFADLLNKAGLTQPEKTVFENVYFGHRGTAAEMWQKAAQQGISSAKIGRLQLQGKLAYLTLNNADLADAIQKEVGSSQNLGVMVDRDFHQEDAWKNLLRRMANNNDSALGKLIPPAYKGEDTAARLKSYSADMARKVRLTFPTRVVARMLEKDELHLGDEHSALKKPVNAFLKTAEGLGFSLGRVPINTFIAQHRNQVFNGIDAAEVEATTRAVKKLHRLYQITPTDEALKLALSHGFGSAYDVAALPYETFLQSYGDKFSADPAVSINVASLFYSKAQQVASVSYNFFTSAKQIDSAPAVYAISPPGQALQEAKNELIKHYPTMESLFGSLDFCECEHCRSVLSPAAYMVDLLQFLDPDEPSWNSFLAAWKATHNNEEYTQDHKKAYDALVERRPDIPHLPLTCENTNTALPYIDVVNEILEYYVANGNLDTAAVHDTGEATTPELLAEPQNILREAYDKLKEARYPIGLPFDLWLETVRKFCDHFGIPLWRVLEIFRGTEKLFSQPADPEPYDLSDIFTEYLGISPSELAIITDADPLANWHKLYGFDDPAKTAAQNKQAALTALGSAKTLARRLGVSYKQLIDLVRTGFANPQLEALVVLGKLGVEVGDVFRFKNNEPLLSKDKSTLSDEELALVEELKAFQQRLTDLGTTFPGFNTAAWLNQAWQNDVFDKVLTLADPDTGCNFDATTLRFADGTSVDAPALVKINLFVRLWKKLGWSIEETDRALRTFLPTSLLPLAAAGIGQAMKTALTYLAHFKWLDERVKAGNNKRTRLLTLWSNLSTTGSKPLYAGLFLTRSVLKQDSVFDNPLGDYLSQSGVFMKDHLLALQAALSLTANEIASILADSGGAIETASLSLPNVSMLYRYGLLAKALKLSVQELITLKSLTGLDPFKPLNAAPLTALDEDHPFTQTVRFVTVAATVKESGFKIEDLDYLLRHRFDPVGEYRQDPGAVLALARSLAFELDRVRDEQIIPASLTDDLLRQKLALALTPESLAAFISAVTGMAEAEATQENVQPPNKLDPKALAGEPRIRVDYSDVLLRQRLTSRGLLLDARKQQLKSANASPLLAALLDKVQALGFASLGSNIESVLASLTDTTEYQAVKKNVQPSGKLDPNSFSDEPNIRVAYDEARSIQHLTWRGLLLNAKKQSLNSSINSPVLADLLNQVQSQGRADAEAVINGSLSMVIAALEFTAFEENVQLANKLDPNDFEPRMQVTYEDAAAWDSSTAYQLDTAVSFNGSIWVAKRTNTNVQPVNGDDWAGPQGRKQSLTLKGLLSDAKKAQLESANPSGVLASLLSKIKNQTDALAQKLRVGLLATSDFDSLFAGLPALSDADEDPRARLAKAFLPFVIRKLTRLLVVQTVASSLGADRDLTEALTTDGALLGDPTEPDSTLVDAFAAAADQGVSAAFFASLDGSGNPLETRLATAVDTADKSGGVNSARFEGYIQVPVAGPYRFFALSTKQNAEVEMRFGDLPNPLLRGKAAADNAESSAFVELKPGISYSFEFKAANLNGGNASLLVQGENLPKGTLARLTLRPSQSVERVGRANLLLAKSLALIKGLGLTEREVRHILTNASDFDGVSLNKLPTREADGSPDQAVRLFGYFLRLIEYTRLKREVAGETDDLIGVFENARHTYPSSTNANQAKAKLFDDLCKRFADMIRRDFNIVRETAASLGLVVNSKLAGNSLRVESPGFASEKGIRRLWDALQAVETLGVSVNAILSSTGIISATKTSEERFAIASDLRNTVKARYEPENWQRIAQPIFDKLRQRQRDALVARIMHRAGFERMEELFEYFLIDPGMEPVVQTSRLRLAISSVQLFIQRCLLNLEPSVHPSAINSKHWEWMKRYRVWEANRKIFLFPENWLEPEFRDDKTHLFQELESTLLGGDVSNDLAEDAFFAYLKKLEELARLEIVAMYCEEKPLDPASNIVHVMGRTYTLPHKYFYRRYQYHMWTPWEPVPVEIDGDHMVAVVWRERLHLFWVTFLEKAKPDNSGEPIEVNFTQGISVPTVPSRQIDVQLSWSEYFQGQWATRESSGFSKPITVDVAKDFDKHEVFIFAVKEYDDNGEEAAVRIQLSGEMNVQGYGNLGQFASDNKWKTAFRVVSKHSAPAVTFRNPSQPSSPPYSRERAEINRYIGTDSLDVTFLETIEDDGGTRPVYTWATKDILRKVDSYSLLIGNPPRLVAPEFGHLTSPFFFEDHRHTFFVEPTLTEETFIEWEDWIIAVAEPDPKMELDDWWKDIKFAPAVPAWVDAAGPVEFDPLALFEIQADSDWITGPQTVLQFDQAWVGLGGGLNVLLLPAMDAAPLNLLANMDSRLIPGLISGGGLNSVALRGTKIGSGSIAASGLDGKVGGNSIDN